MSLKRELFMRFAAPLYRSGMAHRAKISLFIAKAAAKLRTERGHILERFPGDRPAPVTGKVCVFSHFDPHGLVGEHVYFFLESIRKAGFTIYFVTTAGHLRSVDRARLMQNCGQIIRTRNYGRDIGAWKIVIKNFLHLENIDTLLLTNDSVYGPFQSVAQIMERMHPVECDFWGLTDSWDRKYHLQSYFLMFKREVIQSESFQSIWEKFLLLNNKEYSILNGEIAITQKLLAAGFRAGVMCPYHEVRKSQLRTVGWPDEPVIQLVHNAADSGVRLNDIQLALSKGTRLDVPLNSTHFFWRTLIEHFQFPFVKVELLRDNPSQIPDISIWRYVVEKEEPSLLAHIDTHLKRVRSGNAA